MQKINRLMIIFVLFFASFLFASCNTQTLSFDLKISTITLTVDQRYEIEFDESSSSELLNDLTYSFSDPSIAYIIPNTHTVVALQKGTTIVYIKTKNSEIKNLTINVVDSKQVLPAPAGLKLNRDLNRFEWISVPSAYKYNLKIRSENFEKTIETTNTFVSLEELNLIVKPNVQIFACVSAIPSNTDSAFTSSAFSDEVVYNELPAVLDLSFDRQNSKIQFSYDENSSILGENEVYFYINITGAKTDLIRILKNSSNTYVADYQFDEAGEYQVSVKALMSQRNTSKAQTFNVVKLNTPTISQISDDILFKSQNENAIVNLEIESQESQIDSITKQSIELVDKSIKVFASPEFDKVDGLINTYYLPSNVIQKNIKKLENINNFNIKKTDENSVKLEWENLELNYLIFENDEKIDLIQENIEKNAKNYINSEKNNIKDGDCFEYFIVATKDQDDNFFYINSNKTHALKVQKLSLPEITFEGDNKLKCIISENDLGSTLVLTIDNVKSEIVLNELENEIDITSNLSEGQYQIRAYLQNKNQDKVYLNSGVQNFTYVKNADINFEYETSENSVLISFEKIQNLDTYKVILNDVELSTATKSSEYYEYREIENDIEIKINNITSDGEYNLCIYGAGYFDAENKTYYSMTNKSELSFKKLKSPQVSFVISSNLVTFSWNAIDSASNYEVYIINKSNNNTFSASTSELSFLYDFSEFGDYEIYVSAINTDDLILNSTPSLVNIKKLKSVENILTEITEDILTVTFDEVNFALGYKIIIQKNDNIIYQNIVYSNVEIINNIQSVFALGGEYQIILQAVSSEDNIINSETSTVFVQKLAPASSAEVVTINGLQYLNIEAQNPANKYLYSIDSGDVCEINGNKIDVSALSLGKHIISIISEGDGVRYINSNAQNFEFTIKSVLSTPTNLNFENIDENDFRLSFNGVDFAENYKIECYQNSSLVFEQIISPSALNEYSVVLTRDQFRAGVQELSVFAMVENANEKYVSGAKNSLTIIKAQTINGATLDSDYRVNLLNKQAFIDDQEYQDVMLDLNYLASGSDISFNVRNIQGLSAIDDFFNNNFYMASQFVQVNLHKLATANFSLNELLTFESQSEPVEFNAIIKLDFYGQNNLFSYSREFVLSSAEFENGINLRNYIQNKLSNDYVGDFKISVKLSPKSQTPTNIYLPSDYTNEIEFRYVEYLNNNLINLSTSNLGILDFSINSQMLNKIERIYINLIKEGKTISFDITENGISNYENEYNNKVLTADNVSSNLKNNKYDLKINIFELFDGGDFVLQYKVIGDDVYYKSSENFENINLKKLSAPIFTYGASVLGNKIILDSSYVSENANASFKARYNNNTLTFELEDQNYVLYIPYDWQDLSKIKVFVQTNTYNFINSNEADVSFEKVDTVSNLHLEDNGEKAYLVWEDSQLTNHYVYISQDNFATQNIFEVSNNSFEIADNLVVAGNVKFKVVSKAYNGRLNSDAILLNAKKLTNTLEIFNTNGTLTWNQQANEENEIKEYRLKIQNNLYNFAPNIHSFDMAGISGYQTLNFKIVGNPNENVISSDYKEFYVYKYSAPTSFNILDGMFNINEVNLENVTYKIKIDDFIFDYNDYLSYSENTKADFYSKLNSNVGNAQAKIVVKTNDKVVYNSKNYLALSSDYTNEITYNILDIDISNDEFYLTEVKDSSELKTYFNWEWVDDSFKDLGKVRLILRPMFTLNNRLTSSDWNYSFNSDGSISIIYKDITFNNIYNGSTYQKSYVSQLIPVELYSGSYKIEVQKMSIGQNSNLSSKNVEVLNFTKLKTLSPRVNQGMLVWQEENYAENYLIAYTGDISGWQKIYNSYYEPNAIFADSLENKQYTYTIFATGNVTETKPDVLGALEKDYVISSEGFSGTFTKLRNVGNLSLSGGVINFDNSQNYKYYLASNVTSKMEICFLDSNLNLLTTLKVNASELENNPPVAFFENYLTNEQKNVLARADKLIIKYRQLGESFNGFINSEYKFLSGSGYSIIIDNVSYDYFELLKAPTSIGISEETGLSFTSAVFDNSKLNAVNYDVYYQTSEEVQLLTTLNFANWSYDSFVTELKNRNILSADIFVVIRGNGYYISSFKSPTQKVKMINGEIAISCENGNLKWNSLENSATYILEREYNNDYNTYYFVKLDDEFYYYTDLNSNPIKTNCVFENDNQVYLNIAYFDEISAGDHTFKLRYQPKNTSIDVFSIPSDWTSSVRVFKIDMPTLTLNDGIFEWNSVASSEGYKFIINFEGTNILEKDLNVNSYDLDLNAISEIDSNFANNIRNYKFMLQAKGKSASQNNIYFVSSAFSVLENIEIEQNGVENINVNGDIISWSDTNQVGKYILNIKQTDENNTVITKTIVVDSTQYDLSKAELSGDNNSTYQVSIKACGSSSKLSSVEEVSSTTFRALQSVTDIRIENGYIVFKAQDNARGYTVGIRLVNDTHYYTIEYSGGSYVVTSLNVQRISSNQVVYEQKSVEREIDIYESGGYIYFWPQTPPMTSGSYLTVRANGYQDANDDVYISSLFTRYSQQISKLNIERASIYNIQYKNGYLTSFNINLNMKIKCNLIVNILNSDGEEIDVRPTISITDGYAKLVIGESFEAGEYTVEICSVPAVAGSNYLKSKTVSLNLKLK